jgi:hypothetical protein
MKVSYNVNASNVCLDLAGGILLISSLSPKDENNPSFRVASYDTTSFEVLDYTVCIFNGVR